MKTMNLKKAASVMVLASVATVMKAASVMVLASVATVMVFFTTDYTD